MSDNPVQPIVNTGVTPAVSMQVEFKDGVFTVPAWIVELAGGTKSVQDSLPSLKQYTYKAFTDAVLRRANASALRQFQQGLIAGHFERLERGW